MFGPNKTKWNATCLKGFWRLCQYHKGACSIFIRAENGLHVIVHVVTYHECIFKSQINPSLWSDIKLFIRLKHEEVNHLLWFSVILWSVQDSSLHSLKVRSRCLVNQEQRETFWLLLAGCVLMKLITVELAKSLIMLCAK